MSSKDKAFSVQERSLRALGRALRQEADGKEIRKDLIRGMREVLRPVQAEARAAIKSMPVRGTRHAGPSLRTAVARRVGTEVRVAGRRAGARLKAKKTPNVRKFKNAPHRLNTAKGWRHPAPNGGGWVQQQGKPQWFDSVTKKTRTQGKQAARAVLKATARRIAGKVR